MSNPYGSIRETAKEKGVPEHLLRVLRKQGLLPGFQTGNRFYIDKARLDGVLEEMCDRRAVISTAG